MGIRLLNTLIKNSCGNIITQKHLSNFYNKKIVIDISIYAWRYLSENVLTEKIYLMCLLFQYYNIIPIFIFDGKSPKEKRNTILERKQKRESAREKLEYITKQIEMGFLEEEEQKGQLSKLKKQSVNLTLDHINILKNLIQSMGHTYIVAEGEADVLCAQLCLNNDVFACLSEDTDMFAYQCPHIIRYISLTKHSVLFYDLKKIIRGLKLTKEEFNIICMLSGNDYTKSKNVYYYYNKIIKFKKIRNWGKLTFIEWLRLKNFIDVDDIINYENNLKMYALKKNVGKIQINRQRNDILLKEILENDNFLFVE
jgi:flap endonuclease-1